MEQLIDGYYTLDDSEMYTLLRLLNQPEAIKLESSALAGMIGCVHVTLNTDYQQSKALSPQQMANATHLVWATGGGMVPSDKMQKYLSQAKLS